MKCNSCGYEYQDGDKFCPNCGAVNNNANNSTVNQPNNNGFNNNGFNNNGYNNGGYNNNGYNQQGNGGYGGRYTAPIKKRDIVLSIILSIVTCGIYGIIWYIGLVDDLNVAAGTPEDTSGVTVFLLTIITCGIYGIYWAYTAGSKVSAIREKTGDRREDNTGILYLVLNIFGLAIVTYCLIQTELNKVAEY